jgi:hypothetical protein
LVEDKTVPLWTALVIGAASFLVSIVMWNMIGFMVLRDKCKRSDLKFWKTKK